MTVDQSLYKKLERELTYKIPTFNAPDNLAVIKNLKVINTNVAGGKYLVAFPVGRVDLIPRGGEIVDKRVLAPIDDFPSFKGTLRDSQQEIHDDVDDNCIINAKVGFGKTFTALAIAAKLKQKTLIITHTIDLRNQWEKEIQKALGISPGIIGSGKFNTDSPIVVANIQTLVKNVGKVNREFGLVILDEMHHTPSPTFSKVIDAMFARFKIGLSGTIERKDQKHVVFKDYFGSKIYKPVRENTMMPKVDVINTGIYFAAETTGWSTQVTMLSESQKYRDLIVALADKYSRDGHRVMIVSDRVEFLRYGHTMSEHASELLIGGTKDREEVIKRVYSGVSQQLWGTQSMVSEGLSIEPLSCLILATPLNNMPLLEQLIGRVIRGQEGKIDPVVVDVRLAGPIVTKQFNNRLGHYIQQGYEVNYIK